MIIVQLLILLPLLTECLLVTLNPMKMLSSGIQITNINRILKGLIETKQYPAVLGFLKHPAYDFDPIYRSLCRGFTLETFTDIIENVSSFDDQVLLLSDRCLSRASILWNEIEPEHILLLPVSPLADSEFGPLQVKPADFKRILQHALITYSDPRRRPINFGNWMRDSTVRPFNYFSGTAEVASEIISFMNPIILSAADSAYQQHWIISVLERHMCDLMDIFSYSDPQSFWTSLLKLFVVIKSIDAYTHSEAISPETVTKMKKFTQRIIDFVKTELVRGQLVGYGSKAGEMICQLNSKAAPLLSVFDLLASVREDLHPDWLVALLTLNLPASTSDYYKIILYIAARNPHYETLEILEHLFALDLDPLIQGRQFYQIFGAEKMSENPGKWLFKPLQWRFRSLRTEVLPFPRGRSRVEVFSEIINQEIWPRDMFHQIMTDFDEILSIYSDHFTSFSVGSYDRNGSLRSVDFKTFLRRALQCFLNFPELYSGHVETGIIFNPALIPKFYIPILMSFLVHSAFLGEPAPFKLDKKYFVASLRANEPELEAVFKDYYHLFNANHLQSPLQSLALISDSDGAAAGWIKRSYKDNSLSIRISIYRRFKKAQFTASEIYYILFEK